MLNTPLPSVDSSFICVGKVMEAHGLEGKVKVKSFMDTKNLTDFQKLYTEDLLPLTITSYHLTPSFIVCKFKEIPDRNQAELFSKKMLYIPRTVLPELATEEYYYTDLVGLNVWDEQKNPIGTVVQVVNYGAGDILEIESFNEIYYLTFSKQSVPVVDLAQGVLHIQRNYLLNQTGKPYCKDANV